LWQKPKFAGCERNIDLMNKTYLTRKEQIVLSTIELIDKLGIDGLSIRELAKKENITEGAIYKHFKSKNEIIIETIKYFAHFDINIMNTINKNNLDSRSAIIFLLTSYSEYYENYPEITAVSCSFESLLHEPEIENEILLIDYRKLNFLISIINKGKQSGEFNECINSEDFAGIIIGSFRHLVFKWRVEKHVFPLKQRTLDILDLILKVQ
jgi:AcrR family transcriptional regulator